MSSYRGTQDRPEKLKAAAGVIAVHVALGAVILTGLNVDTVRKAVDRMQTIAIFEPEPPESPPPPPEQPRPETARKESGAPAEKAEPTPVVAPEQRIPAPSPIVAAKVAGQGSAATSGAANAGSGTGAGGTGTGTGGGGSGTSGFTPVVLLRNLNRGDYRPLAAGRLPRGSAMVSLTVDTQGMPGNCRVVRSSGDSIVDSGLCPLVTRRLRFRPARDASGRAIPYTLQYVANWSL